jgi:Arc/MetJ family transcription regulator
MVKINIEIDEVACRKAMERYQLATMEDAVNFALNQLINEPMTLEEVLAMEGSGWIGDLAEMRAARFPLV